MLHNVYRICVFSLLFIVVACGSNPDEKTGEDGTRNVAQKMELEKWIPDSVSYDEGDRSDWRMFSIDTDSRVLVEAKVANTDANVLFEIRGLFGKVINKVNSYQRAEVLSFEQKLPKGQYFIGMIAKDDGDNSEYTLRVSIEKGAATIPRPE
jgi:hypothetical protein